jgi:6-pyruvoyl-tetrahydropterin synthase
MLVSSKNIALFHASSLLVHQKTGRCLSHYFLGDKFMFSVEVRDRIMIAHSLPHPFFGPAQGKHGATFVVDVAFFRTKMTAQNVVVDIGAALDVLNKTLKPLAYQDLDTLPQFKGILTTTEFLCKYIFDAMVAAAKSGALGEDGKGLSKVRVTLHETDLARASFEGSVA